MKVDNDKVNLFYKEIERKKRRRKVDKGGRGIFLSISS